jgi:prefoldin subunit 5
MSHEPEPHIKITMQMMYAEQQQTNKMLAQAVTHLENLADVPERLRQTELEVRELKATVKDLKQANKTAMSALIAAGAAIVGTVVNWLN